jgi:hypothetical protein
VRKLLWIALTASAAWTGYWWVGATQIEDRVTAFVAANPQAGVTFDSADVQGVPNRFDLTLTDLTLDRPTEGIRWHTPFAQIYAMTWKPWHLIAALPSNQEITYQGQALTLKSRQIIGDVIVHPNADLGLQEVIVQGNGLELRSDAEWQIGLDTLLASLREDPTTANRYRLGLRVNGLRPDVSLADEIASAELPSTIGEVYLDAHATLSAPLDRSAAQTQPTLTTLDISAARISWGDLLFAAQGSLAPDGNGFAQGEIELRLQGWQKVPPFLVAVGVLQPQMQQPVTSVMAGLASQGDEPDVLVLKLVAKDGRMDLGPFPLGPAPLLQRQ